MEDVIAEVIKEHKEINQDSIVDIIRHFALRGVTIDRTPGNPTLIFFDTRTGMQQEITMNRNPYFELATKIPNMREFHKETNTYLKQITIIIIGVAEEIDSTNIELHGWSVRELLENRILPRAQNRDNPVYHFEHSDKGKRRLKVFCNQHSGVTHVCDRNAEIILKGASEKSLEEVRNALGKIGFDNVDIEYCPERPSIPQRISFQLSLACKEMLSLGNLAKFMWTLLGTIFGAIITFLAQGILSQIFN